MKLDFIEGQTLLFNKPKGWTSFDVVKKVRNAIKIKKVGHAGTLDPLATGLLILCTGKHTKTIEQIQGQEKEYEVLFKLGAQTASYDAEQEETDHRDASHLRDVDIQTAIDQHFTGQIEQTPPIFSAVKVKGKRAYEAARKGETLELKSRIVQIYEFSLLALPSDLPSAYIPAHNEEKQFRLAYARIRCSKGTYIRSLVHDLGQILDVGAYILELKRTRIGEYHLQDAREVKKFVEEVKRWEK